MTKWENGEKYTKGDTLYVGDHESSEAEEDCLEVDVKGANETRFKGFPHPSFSEENIEKKGTPLALYFFKFRTRREG